MTDVAKSQLFVPNSEENHYPADSEISTDSRLNLKTAAGLNDSSDGQLMKQVIKTVGITGDTKTQYDHWLTERINYQFAAHPIILKDGRQIRFVTPENDNQITVIPPTYNGKLMTPLMAADYNQTYSVKIMGVPHLYIPELDKEGNIMRDSNNKVIMRNVIKGDPVTLIKMPLMVGSFYCALHGKTEYQRLTMGTCPHDNGGYFIIKGTDRILPGQEKLVVNRPIIFLDAKDGIDKLLFTSYTITGTKILKINLVDKNISNQGNKKDLITFIGTYLSFFGEDKAKKLIYINIIFIYRIIWPHLTLDQIKNFIFQFIKPEHHNAIIRILQETLYYNSITSNPYQFLLDEMTRIEDYEPNLEKTVINNKTELEKKNVKANEQKRMNWIRNLVLRDLFPHIQSTGDENTDIYNKIQLYSYCVARHLEQMAGKRTPDDRDSWHNKKVDFAAGNMENLFGQFWKKHIEDVTKDINDGITKTNIQQVGRLLQDGSWTTKVNTMVSNLESCFNADAWGTPKAPKKNIAQALARDNVSATVMHLRRIISPAKKQTKSTSLRAVHPTQAAYVDTNSTPESEALGLVKHLVNTCIASQMRDHTIIIDLIKHFAIVSKNDNYPDYDTFLLINGTPIGFVPGQAMVDHLIQMRRKCQIPQDVGIIHLKDEKTIYVLTVWGRLVTPFLVVNPKTHRLIIDEKNLRKASLNKQLREGAIEYLCSIEAWSPQNRIAQNTIDVVEEIDAYDNLKKQIDIMEPDDPDLATLQIKYEQKTDFYTHSLIHPLQVVDIVSSLIPLLNFNQGPRITYGNNQLRQAMGLQSSMIFRKDTTIRTMTMASRPLVDTMMADTIALDVLPQGATVNYAIMTFGGHNIEDAIIVKKEFMQRGGFMNTIYKTIIIKTNANSKSGNVRRVEKFDNPLNDNKFPGMIKDKLDRYANLDTNGVIVEGSTVSVGDCLVGKIRRNIHTKTGKIDPPVNISYFAKVNEVGIVDEVIINTKDNEGEIIVRLRSTVPPIKGDKFSNRHAQKSVIGCFVPEVDMPFAANGWTPDIILSPFAVPSRMTIGMLHEMIMGNYAILSGERVNATGCEAFDLDKFIELMKFYGFNATGKKKLYNGKLGIPIEVMVFTGPMYYQALRHRVDEKIQGQSSGPINSLNRQPIPGRKKNGGLRWGEMERDAVISHGAAHFTRDRISVSSDQSIHAVCVECGEFAIKSHISNDYHCPACKSDNIGRLDIPASVAMFCNMISGENIRISPNVRIRPSKSKTITI